ncbi:fibronectin type III domain-containing protein, partial [Pontimonas sp.]|nr:fibronectin type III domain-containing protein [Pontimonas sp.]
TSSSASLVFGTTATLSVSGGSGTGAVSYAVTSGDCTVSGTTVTATGGTGSCVVTATKAADASYAEATDSVTITLSKASQSALTISVDDSSLDYGDTATLSSPGGSGSGAVTFSVDSGDCSVAGTTVTAIGGTTDCVISAVKAADDDYLVASAANTVTISISKASQTITFGSIATKTYGASPSTVSPTSDSGLTVSLSSSTEAVCTTSGFTITLIAAGTCTVTADQGGNGLYSSATGVTRSFTVSAKALTVSVTVADKVYDASTSATVSSGTLSGVVSGDSVSFVAGNTAAVFGSKTVGSGKAVTVTVDGDELSGSDAANYSLTVSGSPTASITAKPVTVDVVPNGKTYDATQAATVLSSSLVGKETGDTVGVDESAITLIFDAPGAGTQTASATLASGVLTGADAGNYSASVGTVSSAVITKANQTSLSFTSSSSGTFGQPVTLVATGGSGSGSVTYSAIGDCSRSGAVITPTGAGSCSVSATRAADDNFNASTAATQTITIAKANQSINFTSTVPVSAVSGTTYTPTATASSGLPVSFLITTGDGTVCSLNSGVVTFSQSGTCVITAAQSGDTDYNAASSVTQTIVAGKINQTISFPAITGKDFDDPAFSAGASVSSGRTVTYATSTGSVCAVNASSGVVSIKTVGDCTVTASSAGDVSYAAASDVARTFTISPVLAGKPSITSVSFGDSSVTAAFVAPGFVGGDAVDGYQVVATSSGGSVTKPDCSTTSPCTITGLTNGESYTLTVAAINSAGVGSASDTSPSIIPARIADAVSGLATTPGDGQLAVSWTALTDAQVTAAGGTFTRYDVYLRVNGGSWGSAVTPDGTNNLATRTTTSYTFTGLTNGTAYDVKVVAITNANSEELSSNTSTALGVPATVPATVSGLTATALSNTTALASWSAPVDDGGSVVTAYSVNLSCTFVNATDTFCELSGLTAGSTVTVSVGATNLMGTGSTVSVSVTMPGGSSGSGGGSSGPQVAAAATNAPLVVPRRVIVPVQPTPVPRLLAAPVRIIPERGFDPNAGAKARIGGQPATVTKKPLGEGGLSVEVGAFQLGLKLSTPGSSAPSAAGQRSDIDVPTGESTKVSGGGLLPGSSLQVWLPGVTGESPRELARIPVQSDGSFASELSFTSRQSETPIPIGRQVMQVTGYDEQGNQTIVDMVVNIGQGAPAPEPNRSVNELPELSPGQSLATSAGVPETVTIEARPDDREVAVMSGAWAFSVALPDDAGEIEQVDSGATITMVQTKTATVSGEGFQPETRVDIWLFSDPTLLGSVIVSVDGSFAGEVYMDARYATPGEHTLQLQGVADDGFIKAANLGVVVQEPVLLTVEGAGGLLWWVVGVFLLAVLVMVVLLARRRRSV